MRREALLVGIVVLTALALGTPTVRARKVVAVTAHCVEGERHVDHDGKKDACIATARPTCAQGAELVVDEKGDRDVCRKGNAVSKPSCPGDHALKEGLGEDVCQRPLRPECRKGYALRVKVGEDDCTY
jgi:hypothetical protein